MKYKEYLGSPEWRKLKADAKLRANNMCEHCGGMAYAVHHVKYPKDLEFDCLANVIVVCKRCHDLSHGIRRHNGVQPIGAAVKNMMEELKYAR